ncbi:unnamed protein product [Durusdinium trenchii]|uniref:Uncharacterized protein n=1 Tax=Durusdinium trenchii TaxID=1381693 RepID=A0ABP0HPM7_9DINO
MCDRERSPSRSDSSESLTVRDPTEAWNWQFVHPDSGTELFVQALQCLGVDMAKAIPKRVQGECIKALNEEPTAELISGSFRQLVKERLLKNYWCIHSMLQMEVFQSRRPSQAELMIVLDSLNDYYKDMMKNAEYPTAMAPMEVEPTKPCAGRDVEPGDGDKDLSASSDGIPDGHKGAARVEVLLRQQALKAKSDVDGNKISGPKPSFFYSNYRFITSLYLPLPDKPGWDADMSIKWLGIP